MPDRPTVSIRFSAAEIASRVDEMAAELAAKLSPDTLVVSVLKGSFVFAADLIRALSRAGADWSMDFLTLSSYGSGIGAKSNAKDRLRAGLYVPSEPRPADRGAAVTERLRRDLPGERSSGRDDQGAATAREGDRRTREG